MHRQWSELIPYYVAGTLPRVKVVALEQHLAVCGTCRHDLDEWRAVARLVWSEADRWAEGCPPLAQAVRAAPRFSANGHQTESPLSDLTLRQPRPIRSRRPQLSLTLAAALIVLVAASILIYAARQGDDEPETASIPLTVPGRTAQAALPTLTPGPSRTGTPSPATATPPADLGIVSPGGTLSATPSARPPVTTRNPNGLAPGGICTAASITGDYVPYYDAPDLSAPVIGYLAPGDYRPVGAHVGRAWYYLLPTETYGPGWIGASLTKLYGPCDPLAAVTITPSPTTYVTPTPLYGYGFNGYALRTTGQVGSIPAGTDVWVSYTWYDGETYFYGIVDREGHSGEAREDQLMPLPGYTPGPMPTSDFQGAGGMGYLLMTTEQVGAIPAGARVRLSHSQFNGDAWIYVIVAEDGVTTAEARAYQITYAPDVTPGPTPTSRFDAVSWSSGYPVITLEQVGDIPAGTRVRIGGGWFRGPEWEFSIVAEGELLVATALDHQLALAPGAIPLDVTPTASFYNFVGRDDWYYLQTKDWVGTLPPGTWVRVTGMWFDGTTWMYDVIDHTGQLSGSARQDQLLYPPPGVPTPTP